MIKAKPEITTHVFLETRVINKQGLHPLKLRVYDQNIRKYYTLKEFRFTAENYNDIMNPEQTVRTKKALQGKIIKKELDAREVIDEQMNEFSFEEFEALYFKKRKTRTNLKECFEEKIDFLQDMERYSTASLYQTTLNSIIGYKKDFSFNNVTKNELIRYEKHLKDSGKSISTISIYMRNLRTIFNANKHKHKLTSPFNKDAFIIKKGENKATTLNKAEILALINYQTSTENQRQAQAYWVFSYFSSGMNMTDIARLKYSNIVANKIEYIRHKTRNTKNTTSLISAQLNDKTKEIINTIGNPETTDGLVFPILNGVEDEEKKTKIIKQHTKTTNKYLAQISKALKFTITPTTYDARHGFSNVLKNSEVPIAFISKALGHSSISVTESYLHGFEEGQEEDYTSRLT